MEQPCEICGAWFDVATGVHQGQPVVDADGNNHWVDTAECNNDWLTLSAAKELIALVPASVKATRQHGARFRSFLGTG